MTPEQGYGNGWAAALHPEDRQRVQSEWAECVQERRSLSSEFRILQPDGVSVWVLGRGVEETDSSGTAVGYIGTIVDISDRKEVEEILRQAKEAAEDSNQAKSTFLANMSHELRTPLHGILSFAQIGERKAMTAPPAKLQSYFQLIDQSGNTLLALLNDLLDLAKLESGKMQFEFQPTDLIPVVGQVVDEFQSVFSERQLTLTSTLPADPISVSLDTIRIQQVVRNLLSNAAKFSPEQGEIDLRVVVEDQRVKLSVRDQGPGIPAQELETVFEKFIQSSATQSGAGGTGLGLAICREIVSAHHGHIWVENRTEGGADFMVEFPLQSASAAENNDPAQIAA